MTDPQLFIYKNKNKSLIKNIMNNLDWESNSEATDLANSDSLSLAHLKAMRLVARMREAADNCGAGFVGGFISPTGERFMMSNVDADDIQFKAITQQLDDIQDDQNAQLKKLMQESKIQEILESFEG